MNVVITGASKGIGKECAQKFCQNNTENLILIARNEKLLEKTASECARVNKDAHIHVIPFDLNKLLSDERLPELEKIGQITNTIDILLNNAGLLINKLFIEMSTKESKDIVHTNFLAPAALIRFLLPQLENSSIGHIVNIGSMGGFQGSSKYPGLSYYSASKAALSCMGECLAAELAEKNIRVNTLSLGAVQTEMLHEAFPGYKAPLEAREIADFIVDFALSGWKYFNGTNLPVSLSNP